MDQYAQERYVKLDTAGLEDIVYQPPLLPGEFEYNQVKRFKNMYRQMFDDGSPYADGREWTGTGNAAWFRHSDAIEYFTRLKARPASAMETAAYLSEASSDIQPLYDWCDRQEIGGRIMTRTVACFAKIDGAVCMAFDDDLDYATIVRNGTPDFEDEPLRYFFIKEDKNIVSLLDRGRKTGRLIPVLQGETVEKCEHVLNADDFGKHPIVKGALGELAPPFGNFIDDEGYASGYSLRESPPSEVAQDLDTEHALLYPVVINLSRGTRLQWLPVATACFETGPYAYIGTRKLA